MSKIEPDSPEYMSRMNAAKHLEWARETSGGSEIITAALLLYAGIDRALAINVEHRLEEVVRHLLHYEDGGSDGDESGDGSR